MAVSFGRAAFLYLFLIITMRLMGKRQVGQMEPSEVVVAMLMADLASIPMDDPSIPCIKGSCRWWRCWSRSWPCPDCLSGPLEFAKYCVENL